MFDVTLHLYDLSQGMAKQMSMAFLGKQIDGIWHTGIVVYGREFFFGGGIQDMPPQSVVAQFGMQPVQRLALGKTALDEAAFRAHLRSISPRFTMATYDLLRNNCNNFSDAAAKFLLGGQGIPRHIIDLPSEALSTPMGAMLRPMIEGMQQQMSGGGGGGGGGGAMPFAIPGMGGGGPGGGAAPPAFGIPFNAPPPAAAAPAPAPAPAAAPAAAAAAAAPAPTPAPGPFLVPDIKALTSTDAAAVPKLAARLAAVSRAFAAAADGSAEQALALPVGCVEALEAVAADPQGKLASAAHPPATLVDALVRVLSAWPAAKGHFHALCILRLAVLAAPGADAFCADGGASSGIAVLLAALDGQAPSKAVLVMGLCALSNLVACDGERVMVVVAGEEGEEGGGGGGGGVARAHRDSVLAVGLQQLRSAWPEVRQMAAALLFNAGLALGCSASGGDGENADAAVQLLLGAMEGVGEEADGETAFRRLLAIGVLVGGQRPGGVASESEAGALALARDLGMAGLVAEAAATVKDARARQVALEIGKALDGVCS
jgi:hypothetical protein